MRKLILASAAVLAAMLTSQAQAAPITVNPGVLMSMGQSRRVRLPRCRRR